MNIGEITVESWGQPPICFYRMEAEGDCLYATKLDYYYGIPTLEESEIENPSLIAIEDMEDLALFEESLNDPVVSWDQVKQELTKDGIL